MAETSFHNLFLCDAETLFDSCVASGVKCSLSVWFCRLTIGHVCQCGWTCINTLLYLWPCVSVIEQLVDAYCRPAEFITHMWGDRCTWTWGLTPESSGVQSFLVSMRLIVPSTQTLPQHLGKPEFPDTGWYRINIFSTEGKYQLCVFNTHLCCSAVVIGL